MKAVSRQNDFQMKSVIFSLIFFGVISIFFGLSGHANSGSLDSRIGQNKDTNCAPCQALADRKAAEARNVAGATAAGGTQTQAIIDRNKPAEEPKK